MKELIEKIFVKSSDNTILQLFRYTFVGGFAFLVDIGLLYVFTEYCHFYYLVSATLSFICGLLVNYVLSKLWVFNNAVIENKQLEFTLFAIIGVIGLGLNNLFIWLLSDYLHIWYIFSKVITTIITYLWNFFARKYMLFSKKAQ